MRIETLDRLLEEELKDIYNAETQLVKALPKMAKAASSPELQEAINEHLEVTKAQVERLDQVFASLGLKPGSKTCAGMKGLIEEGRETMGEEASDELLDMALIGAAQRVEHYEMAAYGTARAFAERLGNSEVVDLLQETLDEEKEADEKLTEISESLLQNLSEEGLIRESNGSSRKAGAKAGSASARRDATRSAGSSTE